MSTSEYALIIVSGSLMLDPSAPLHDHANSIRQAGLLISPVRQRQTRNVILLELNH